MLSLLHAGYLVLAGLLIASCRPGPDLSAATPVEREPRLDPDYTSLVIPPNIAPLNFRIVENGRDFVVRISSDAAPSFELRCPDGRCRIGLATWREMLDRNRGKRIYYDVYARNEDGTWVQFQRITNTIADDPIDSYVVYRRLAPNSQFTSIKGIFQRDLETFESSPLVTLRSGTFQCFNCHTFHQNNPDRFLFHIRRKHSGTMLVMDGEMRKVNTKQGPMFRPLAYASWHPDGRHIAATLNMYVGNSPSTDHGYYFQAVEKRGDLAVYDVEDNTISTTGAVFGKEYIETHPTWSHDGRHIYFVRCPDQPILSHRDLDKFKSDLMRISYDTATDTWGAPETVVPYSEVGKSCAFPRPSPCGRYVLHILADKGTYPIYQKSSDVYILDLESMEYWKPLEISSDFSESYPRWSSSGRWFSFLSNRGDGRSALPYFAYFDSAGQAHKAFVLPQEDPAYYDTFTDAYNVLELVKSRVDIDPFELARAMQRPAEEVVFPNPPDVDAVTRATWEQIVPEDWEIYRE